MDLKRKKYKIIEALLKVEEPSIINDLENILKMNSDWNSETSDTEKLFIEDGLQDIAKGNTFTNEEVIQEINEKYGL